MGWGSWLLALAGPVARRVMISLGLAVVTYTGVSTAVNGILANAKAAWTGSLSADVLNLVAMAGINTALSILAGACIARVSLVAMKRLMPT